MIYGKNITSLGSYGSGSVVAEEGYEGVVGSLQIMTESYINEGKMFKYLIEKDFQEAVDMQLPLLILVLIERKVLIIRVK